MKTWISIFLLFTLCGCTASGAQRVSLSAEFPPGSRFMQIRLLGTVMIPAGEVDGEFLTELSGLAWDEDEQLLYAVSDRGSVFHLVPHFDGQKLLDVKIRHGYPLLNEHNKKLKGKKDDSEGLAVLNGNNGKKGDSQLLISFEGKPRIKRYTPNGTRTGSISLPKVLRAKAHYQSGNKGLEAVTYHPKFGIITIPERPLKKSNRRSPTLYSIGGKQWQLPIRSNPASSIVGLETLADGSILVLERIYNSIVEPVIIALQKIHLHEDCETGNQRPCDAETIATFNSAEGWSVDNFEGLTHHRGSRFFIVSDNNDFWLQRTLLTYFEIVPGATTAQ